MSSVAVLVTAHNNEPVIERTLQSVQASVDYLRTTDGRRFHDLPVEVVVVDDGSRDQTLSAIFALTKGNPLFRVVRRSHPSSPSCARNTAVMHSRGELLCFLDGDDRFLPPHLYECCQGLEDQSLDFFKTGVQLADPVHPDWKRRIEYSIVINLCVRRRCHEFIGGFPDHHVFRRQGDDFQHMIDVDYKLEDMRYNQLLSRLFRRGKIARETVVNERYPGNSLDRLYEKFCRPPGTVEDDIPEERRLQLVMSEALLQFEFHRLQQLLRKG